MPNAMMIMFFHRRQYNLPNPGSSQVVTRSIQLGKIRPKNDRHSAPTSDMTGPNSGTAIAMATMKKITNNIILKDTNYICVLQYVLICHYDKDLPVHTTKVTLSKYSKKFGCDVNRCLVPFQMISKGT